MVPDEITGVDDAEVILGIGIGTNLGLNDGTDGAPINMQYNLKGNCGWNYNHYYDSNTFEMLETTQKLF